MTSGRVRVTDSILKVGTIVVLLELFHHDKSDVSSYSWSDEVVVFFDARRWRINLGAFLESVEFVDV